MMKRFAIAIVFLLTASVQAEVAEEPLVFADQAQEDRFAELTRELRCLVCQNQTLADSDAPLAQDLRKEIHQMIQAGSSDEEIKTFLVDRYGDFVLYRPPVAGSTLGLWLLPALLLAGGAIVVFLVVKRSGRAPKQPGE